MVLIGLAACGTTAGAGFLACPTRRQACPTPLPRRRTPRLRPGGLVAPRERRHRRFGASRRRRRGPRRRRLTSRNSVILYRLRLVEAGWTVTWRTLVEPAMGLTPFLPIGGSFDTFGAIVAWFRPSLATDGQENAYVAIWAGQRRIPAHVTAFDDSVEPLPHDPDARDSDVLLSKIDAPGARRWTRVVGTRFEDEPYALAASGNQAVVVGRSRANPGNDNTRWDAWLAAVDGEGTLIASRTLPFDASGIFLGVAIDAEGGIVTGGSDGWNQNPDGLSILDYGAKLLVTLAHADGPLVRVAVPAGPRHNEIRSVAASPDGLWYAGHKDGPITHGGDADPGQIHATGVVGAVPVER